MKSQILAEGLTPFDHAGAERTRHRRRRRDRHAPAGADRAASRRCPASSTVTPISRPFKLTSREFHPEDTVIRVLDAVIGDGVAHGDGRAVLGREPRPAVRDRRRGRGRRRDDPPRRRVQAADDRRTASRGSGVEALRYLAEARERTGLPVITEVMEPNQVDIVAEYADILQIGTRNMQNYSLLTRRRAGRPAGHAQARLRRDRSRNG